MKKLILFSLLLAMSSISTALFGQSTIPSLGKLMAWANNMSHANFDKEVRKLGLSFEEKTEEDKRIIYDYLRKIKKGGTTYTEQVGYRVSKNDKSTSIQFGTSRVDLLSFYSNSLTANKFVTVECGYDTESNKTAFCYQTSKFFVRLIDTKMHLGNRLGNAYIVIVYKR